VAEFSLLAIPLCLAVVAATNYCLNVYIDTLLRTTAISAARFASLADTTFAQAEQRAEQVCHDQFEQISANCEITFEPAEHSRVNLRITYRPLSLLFFQPREVVIDVSSSLEIAK
jgi:hypothetical protein